MTHTFVAEQIRARAEANLPDGVDKLLDWDEFDPDAPLAGMSDAIAVLEFGPGVSTQASLPAWKTAEMDDLAGFTIHVLIRTGFTLDIARRHIDHFRAVFSRWQKHDPVGGYIDVMAAQVPMTQSTANRGAWQGLSTRISYRHRWSHRAIA